MIKITQEKWDRIPKDYKSLSGERKVFAGCLVKGGGTSLITEGKHFEIIKEDDES